MEAHVALGQVHSYDGEMTQAIAQFEAARRIAETDLPAAVPDLDSESGRRASPQGGDGQRALPRARRSLSAVRARRHAAAEARGLRQGRSTTSSKLLGTRADDVEAKWLLNVGYMATGGYPGLVPPRYPMPSADFASPEDVGRFVDVAARAGRGLVLARPAASSSTTSTTTGSSTSSPRTSTAAARCSCSSAAPNGHVRRSGRARRVSPSSSAASTCCRPTTTTTAARTCSSCAAGGSWRSGSRCCATTATARSPT